MEDSGTPSIHTMPFVYDVYVQIQLYYTACSILPVKRSSVQYTRNLKSDLREQVIICPSAPKENRYTLDRYFISMPTDSFMAEHPDHYYYRHKDAGLMHSSIAINHDRLSNTQSECNKLRADPSPGSPRFASRLASGQVEVYRNDSDTKPTQLSGAKGDLFALGWSHHNQVATASEGGDVVFWDLARPTAEMKLPLSPGTGDPVNDIDWYDEHVMVAGIDGGRLVIKDIRGGVNDVSNAHTGDVMCAKVIDGSFVLTTSGQGWALRDIRKPATMLFANPTAHMSEIFCLEPNPTHPTVFATGSKDGVVQLWDLAALGREPVIPPEDEAADSGLLFRHAQHTNEINDIQWAGEWTLATVAGDYVVQLWSPKKQFRGEYY